MYKDYTTEEPLTEMVWNLVSRGTWKEVFEHAERANTLCSRIQKKMFEGLGSLPYTNLPMSFA